MPLSLSSQGLASGSFSPGTFTAGMALSGTTYYPAVAMLSAAGAIVDPSTFALDGTDATGLTPPAGATGIRGWLSSIWNVAQQPVPGAVLTNPPSYTSGTTAALSLTTGGALRVDPSATGVVPYAQGATTAGETGPLIQAASLNAPPLYVTAKTNPLTTDLASNLRVGNGRFSVTPSAGAPAITNVSHAPGTVVGSNFGTTTQAIQFAKVGDGGEINKIIVSTYQAVTVGLKAYVFSQSPGHSTFTDAVAIAFSTLDLPFLADIVNLNPPDAGLGMTIWTSPIGTRIPVSPNTGFFIALVVTGSASFTPAVGSFNIMVNGTY